jgi:hypothetical protein
MVRPVPGGNILMWRLSGKCGEITPQICQARNFGAMITAAQCRSARTLLSWSLNKLASAASVPANVIDSFEMERQRPDAATIGALQRAFEDVGWNSCPMTTCGYAPRHRPTSDRQPRVWQRWVRCRSRLLRSPSQRSRSPSNLGPHRLSSWSAKAAVGAGTAADGTTAAAIGHWGRCHPNW